MSNEEFIEYLLKNSVSYVVDEHGALKFVDSLGDYIMLCSSCDVWAMYSSAFNDLPKSFYKTILEFVITLTPSKLEELKETARIEE